MSEYSEGIRKEQEGQFAGALFEVDPHGDILYVDSQYGSDGKNGSSPRVALKTLTRALALAGAGDTIILDKGGSETITSGLTVTVNRLKIICKTDNNRSGYSLSGAGTLDLITVSGTDVEISGIQFKHTGATANAACVLGSAAAHRLTVRNCACDDTAIVTTMTGMGVELTAGGSDRLVEGCLFLDTKYGVQVVASGTNIETRLLVRNNEFFVGGAAFFGVFAAAGTGSVQSPRLDCNKFHEADGDGTSATAAWNGTDNTNATQGPISFGANVDQYRICDNEAYTALSTSFDVINAINAGAAGELIRNSTGQGGDTATAADCTSSEVVVNANTTAKVTSGEAIVNANTTAKITSGEVVINANTDAKVTSGEGVVNANTNAKVTSGEVVIAGTTTASCTSSEVVINAATVTATGKAGKPVGIHAVIADNTVPNNTQTKVICTATTGAVWIEEIILAKDGVLFAGPTNIEITTDNVYGPTGATNLMANLKAGLAANLSLRASQGAITPFVPMVLETGKKLYIEGSDAAGTSAGNICITVKGCAMADGAYLA